MKTLINQQNQIAPSSVYSDTLASGSIMQISASSIQDDLNAARTQIRQLLHGTSPGHWYDIMPVASSSYGIATGVLGVSELNLGLFNLQKQFTTFSGSTGSIPIAHASSHLVGGSDTLFPINAIQFNTSSIEPAYTKGQVFWDAEAGTELLFVSVGVMVLLISALSLHLRWTPKTRLQ